LKQNLEEKTEVLTTNYAIELAAQQFLKKLRDARQMSRKILTKPQNSERFYFTQFSKVAL
jgi:hypothetical protein